MTPENPGRGLGQLQPFLPVQSLPPGLLWDPGVQVGVSPSLPPALPCFVLPDQGKEWQSWHRGQGAPPSVLASSQRRECPHFPGPPLLQDGRMGWDHLGSLEISSAEICSLLSSITRFSSGYFIYFVINSVYFIHPANGSAHFFPPKKFPGLKWKSRFPQVADFSFFNKTVVFSWQNVVVSVMSRGSKELLSRSVGQRHKHKAPPLTQTPFFLPFFLSSLDIKAQGRRCVGVVNVPRILPFKPRN